MHVSSQTEYQRGRSICEQETESDSPVGLLIAKQLGNPWGKDEDVVNVSVNLCIQYHKLRREGRQCEKPVPEADHPVNISVEAQGIVIFAHYHTCTLMYSHTWIRTPRQAHTVVYV